MSNVSKLVQQVAKLDAEKSRRVSAFVGAIVGDAAGLSLDWIYDQDKLNKIVGEKNPEFWPESHCPFFKLPNGKTTCYADEGHPEPQVYGAKWWPV